MITKNTNLHAAKAAKNDEFYTQLSDIEKEVKHYKDFLNGKVVYCNCDDPLSSNFTKYFILNFHFLGLKKLICTFYDINNIKKAYAFVYEGQDLNGDGQITEEDIEIIRKLKAYHQPLVDDPGFVYENKDELAKKGIYGSGDFRSQNCIEYLKMSDVVITNPPFSLFREYVCQLMEYNKKFLIIGNQNAINYLCPMVKENKIWIGYTSPTDFEIQLNEVEDEKKQYELNGKIYQKFGNICWFTNIDHTKRHEPLELYKKYSNENYPKYDNYDAIECSKVSNIPVDYDGVIGVPISFLNHYCPEQFKILGITYSKDKNPDVEKIRMDKKHRHVGIINGKEKYPRILICRK